MALNESPSEKEGKSHFTYQARLTQRSLNESPSEKEGKYSANDHAPSACPRTLNESPSEKEGKLCGSRCACDEHCPQ